MSNRVISKNLAAQEDLLFGEGLQSQKRAGGNYVVSKIRAIYPVNSLEELNSLDPDKFPKARLYTDNGVEDYIYTNGQYIRVTDSSLKLKIFQSPTNNLTKVSTFAGGVGVVYEVRKTSDNSLATIYSDKGGVNPITQNGTSNISDANTEVVFYIADGDYTVTINTVSTGFMVGVSSKNVTTLDGLSLEDKLSELDRYNKESIGTTFLEKAGEKNTNWFFGGSGVAVMGDSISHGAFALDIYRNNWVNVLKRCFNAEYNSESYGFVNINDTLGFGTTLSQEVHNATRGAGFTYLSGLDAKWSISGGAYVSNSSGSVFTVDVPSFQKEFGVWYRALPGGGSFDIEVNGVVVRTVDTSSGNGGYFVTKSLDVEDNGFGVCNIRLITKSTSPVYLIGMQYEPVANATCLHNFSNSGRRLAHVDKDVIDRTISGANVFIMALGHNDAADCETDTSYLAEVQQRIDWIIRACKSFGVPIVIPDFNWSRGEDAKIRVELKRLADALDRSTYIAFPDFFNFDGSTAASSELINDFELFYDASHPNVLGHKIIAETIAKALRYSCSSKTEALDFYDFWTVVKIPAGDVTNASTDPNYSFAYKKNGSNMLVRGNLSHTTSPFPSGAYVISDSIPTFNFSNSTLHSAKINTSALDAVAYIETRFGQAGFRLHVKGGNTLGNMNFDLVLPLLTQD